MTINRNYLTSNNIDGVVNNPPPPAIESIKDAKNATKNKIMNTVDSSYR